MAGRYTTPPAHTSRADGQPTVIHPYGMSPISPTPKHVTFELLFPESPAYKARLPMRVQIFPHDTTDSIITTVKNFYGLYEGPNGIQGVSFEDEQGNTLIARYENLRDRMIVYVRVIPDYTTVFNQGLEQLNAAAGLRKGSSLDDPHAAVPSFAQPYGNGQPHSRPSSRLARKRSVSPQSGRGRRSQSATTMKKPRSRSGAMSRQSSSHGFPPDHGSDGLTGYSSGDGAPGSATGSRKSRNEQVASADISLDNIVEGGRRKRAKFESSELPLFVPPQVPAPTSISSVSPQRGLHAQTVVPPEAYAMQSTISYNPMHSQNYTASYAYTDGVAPSYSTPPGVQHGHRLRTRGAATYPPTRQAFGAASSVNLPGILPTPDPTVASCISDEDVALQLMRLGDTSNISNGTRNSTSTLDDELSGAADVASSSGATSEHEEDADQPSLPAHPVPKLESSPIPRPGTIKKRPKHLDEILPSFDSTDISGDEGARADDEVDEDYEYEERKDASFLPNSNDVIQENAVDGPTAAIVKIKVNKSKTTTNGSSQARSGTSLKSTKAGKSQAGATNKTKAKSAPSNKVPISPTSLSSHSRKPSTASTLNFQHQLGEDEEDLSTKPRCQRCRKSKKGCDRQRPCQRCKDAGIGIEGCISEDEGNGRKGRYGRHMGVPVKKETVPIVPNPELQAASAILGGIAAGDANADKSKKRKR
ncbi:hypothetical protein L228DRAFT_235592 [Xylona heveae TC161]|uniref:Zn(2)-C6 fungal-type domain-containing protein n=1 Tax=Xylona heveae (strain CBS 132557 / TC161) TaxID=1328760 RepID=A0A165JR97_XYLHT|nr:hypothetical protein L228DRAFT_235592 [Xylona heveae TC161]KZF26536.1 hypothetical protein L228DRAFT_235592 [Xylona heveae TC161]